MPNARTRPSTTSSPRSPSRRTPMRRSVSPAEGEMPARRWCRPSVRRRGSSATAGFEPLALFHRALVSPPVALTLHVFARILAEIGRTEDEDLEALRPALITSPRAGRDAHHVPLLDLDDLVVELHPPAPAHDHVQLLLLLVRVAVREAIVGRDALVAQAALLELERLACEAKLQVRRAVEVGPKMLQR